MFQAETILSAPEIILQPNAGEIEKMCVQCIRECVEVTKVRILGSLLQDSRERLVPCLA